MSYKAKWLLLETMIFAVAVAAYTYLFYDTYCEFFLELLDCAKPLVEVPVTLVAKAEGDTSA